MMTNKLPNIYTVVVFDLKPKVKDYIDELNQRGQIDLDEHGYPYLLKVEQNGSNMICHISRNGKVENFIMPTRKKRDPVCSWDEGDGFVRTGGKKVITVDRTGTAERPKKERPKRSMESFHKLVDQLLQG